MSIQIMDNSTDQESFVAGENMAVCQISGETKKVSHFIRFNPTNQKLQLNKTTQISPVLE
ncbi:hypothetical protein DK28_0214790 [Peptococcaceae bacterium SCADC1_2_3]|jgi:hypothetical protein|nr:hypothetical protein DK28_0214790 [Peptococcaceae bacterium SCADC1_2_3]KFI35757.1 hypothetical protein HY00_01650 [Peptococcaceae bacterium SCADC1_2_3]